jgi:hypothetical protein
MMRTRQTIKAGKRGTKKYLQEYGSKLLCVRYYYDWKNKKRKTTIEIIVGESEWEPKRIPNKTIVKVEVGRTERDIQQKIWQNGGKWNAARKVWEIPFEKVKELGLQKRMVRKK